MTMGKRKRGRQERLWIEAERLAEGPAHPFYRRLNKMLDGESFDDFVEAVGERFAEKMGRSGGAQKHHRIGTQGPSSRFFGAI